MFVLQIIFRALASYWLAITVLALLLVLTFLGTLEQVEHGLYATQEKYFNSLFLVHDINGIPLIPLPGAYLLMTILAVNLLLGGVMRFRFGRSSVAVLIIHAGILFMLLSGFITYEYSIDGHLTLYEHERSNEFLSYYDWEIAIARAGAGNTAEALIIPGAAFRDAHGGRSRAFVASELPFTLRISDYAANARVLPAGPGQNSGVRVVDGVYLARLPSERQQERNVAGAYLTLVGDDGAKREGIVWGLADRPFLAQIGDESWSFTLQRRRWQLPFTVQLDRFTRELHPGTNIPAAFSSDVTVEEPGAAQHFHISMNRPLRYKGYTLFQASWGPPDAGPNDRLFSTFAVVRNPADQFPLYACIIIAAGLLIHFSQRLFQHLQQQPGRL